MNSESTCQLWQFASPSHLSCQFNVTSTRRLSASYFLFSLQLSERSILVDIVRQGGAPKPRQPSTYVFPSLFSGHPVLNQYPVPSLTDTMPNSHSDKTLLVRPYGPELPRILQSKELFGLDNKRSRVDWIIFNLVVTRSALIFPWECENIVALIDPSRWEELS